MIETLKKTSAEWYNEIKTHIIILDCNGWDRQNYEYAFQQELITKDEFERRLIRSTIEMIPINNNA